MMITIVVILSALMCVSLLIFPIHLAQIIWLCRVERHSFRCCSKCLTNLREYFRFLTSHIIPNRKQL